MPCRLRRLVGFPPYRNRSQTHHQDRGKRGVWSADLREIGRIESSYGELTDEIRVQFRKEWFELLVRQYLFQIKYDDPVEHVVLLKKVDDVEGKINEVLGQVDSLRTPPAAYSLPALGLLIGRNEEVKLRTESWLRDRLSPLLILGPPGIGKSKSVTALLHDDPIRSRFGERRYHIRCDALEVRKRLSRSSGRCGLD